MAQPRLLAPPQTSKASTSTPSRAPTSAGPARTSTNYRPPPSSKKPSGASPFLEPKRRAPPPPKPKASSTLPQIDGLQDKLPEIPYLISIQGRNGEKGGYPGHHPYEDQRGTPFQDWEWDKLQYMSMIPGDVDRELVFSRGLWTDEMEALDPWGDISGRNTPWNSAQVSQPGSGGNTVRAERKKVSFGDYLKKKKDSPNDTPANSQNGEGKKVEVPKVVVNGNGVVAEKSDSSKIAEVRKEAAIQKIDAPKLNATKLDLPATYKKVDEKPAVTNGHAPNQQSAQSSQPSQPTTATTSQTASQSQQSQPEREEGELADEPSLPESIAKMLKAPIGQEPRREARTFTRTTSSVSQLSAGDEGAGGTKVPTVDFSSQPSSPMRKPQISPQKQAVQKQTEKPREQERPPSKRPLEEVKKPYEAEKRQRVEKAEAPPTSAPAPYTGTARPHQRQASGNLAPNNRAVSKPSTPLLPKPTASAAPRARENERPRKDDSTARRDERRDGPARSAMPRLLSPLPDHLASTNGTPMQRTDSRDSRRERSPPRSVPMQKSDSRDSRRGDRSPLRSVPMQKSDSRDSRRGDRSPPRSHPMQKSDSRDSRRERSPHRSQPMQKSDSRDSRRDRSPPRSQPMQKSDSRDSQRARSPVKKDEAPTARPRKLPWEVAPSKITSAAAKPSASSSAGPSRESSQKKADAPPKKKEPIPMPALFLPDLPSIVTEDMKRRIDLGTMDKEVEAAVSKLIGHKRQISNVSNGTSSSRDNRDDTPPAERKRKLTALEAKRATARNPDTPGVARKAVSSRAKTKVEKKVVILRFDVDDDDDVAEKIGLILKTKPDSSRLLPDYQDRRGREMIAKRINAVKSSEAAKAGTKRPRPSPDQDDEDQSPIKRSRKDKDPSTPKDSSASGSQTLAPPSISKLKKESTPDKAGTPGERQIPKDDPPISPTATRSHPPSNPSLTPAQRESIKSIRADSERYIALGTSLKRQRDALIRPSPGATISEADTQKANIIGVESLLAYLVGFEAMDRAFKLEGTRNKGPHWRSLFPYLDSFRAGLKAQTAAGEEAEKMKAILDIVATAVGYTGASCLASLLNSVLEKEGVMGSREEMAAFVREQVGNFKRREGMAEAYRKRCGEVVKRWPEAVKGKRALSWIVSPGGQGAGVEEVKGRLSGVVREVCGEGEVEWVSKLDF